MATASGVLALILLSLPARGTPLLDTRNLEGVYICSHKEGVLTAATMYVRFRDGAFLMNAYKATKPSNKEPELSTTLTGVYGWNQTYDLVSYVTRCRRGPEGGVAEEIQMPMFTQSQRDLANCKIVGPIESKMRDFRSGFKKNCFTPE